VIADIAVIEKPNTYRGPTRIYGCKFQFRRFLAILAILAIALFAEIAVPGLVHSPDTIKLQTPLKVLVKTQ